MKVYERAALAFLAKLLPGFANRTDSPRRRDLEETVKTAFWSYQEYGEEYGAKFLGKKTIKDWQWPYHCLDEGMTFPGNEPWSVLFRHAIVLALELNLLLKE